MSIIDNEETTIYYTVSNLGEFVNHFLTLMQKHKKLVTSSKTQTVDFDIQKVWESRSIIKLEFLALVTEESIA